MQGRIVTPITLRGALGQADVASEAEKRAKYGLNNGLTIVDGGTIK